jgi:hypothetical protein
VLVPVTAWICVLPIKATKCGDSGNGKGMCGSNKSTKIYVSDSKENYGYQFQYLNMPV